MEVRAAPLGGGAATSEELVEQFQGKVGFFAGDGEGGRQGEDVLIISAHVEHQAVLAHVFRNLLAAGNVVGVLFRGFNLNDAACRN